PPPGDKLDSKWWLAQERDEEFQPLLALDLAFWWRLTFPHDGMVMDQDWTTIRQALASWIRTAFNRCPSTRAPSVYVFRFVDLADPAGADGGDDFIRPEASTGTEGHLRGKESGELCQKLRWQGLVTEETPS